MSLSVEIKKIPGLELIINEDLTAFTTMRLSSRGDLARIRSVNALKELLPLLNHHKKNYLVVGWGANQILPPQINDLVLHLEFPFDPAYLNKSREEYDLPASLGLNHLTSHAVKFGLQGWEVFTGIPASLGGAITMNAGTSLGEIGSLVKEVSIVTPDGQLRREVLAQKSFSYRHNNFLHKGEVLVGAKLFHRGLNPDIALKIKEYLDYRKNSQPLATRNCGCVFKNPAKDLQAGKLIDRLGLKGLTVGGLRVSPKHGNFVENTGQSDWDQMKELIDIIKSNMDVFYGIEFELEVKIPYD